MLAGRLFGLAVATLVYVLAQLWTRSVFQIASVAFGGYVTLTPTLFLGARWRRFTAKGAVASIVAGSLVYYLGLAGRFPLGGFLPVFWAFLAALVAAVAVSLMTEPSDERQLDRAFGSV